MRDALASGIAPQGAPLVFAVAVAFAVANWEPNTNGWQFFMA